MIPLLVGAGLYGLGKANKAAGRVREADQVDPRYKQFVAEQSAYANQFRNRLGAYKQEQADVGADRGKMELAQKMAATRRNLSGRGLLYGGVGAGAQAGNQAQLASALAQDRARINAESEAQAQTLDQQALQQAMQLRQMEQDRNEYNYNQKVAAAGRSKGLLGSVLGAVGSLAGMAGGSGGQQQYKTRSVQDSSTGLSTGQGANVSNIA
jgi:hypothetical protein